MGRGDTLLNALVGAAVTVVLSFVGFSPLLGGGVAGYLQRESRRNGAKVGALAGALAVIPTMLFAVVFFGVFLVGMVGGGLPGGPELLVLFFVFGPLLVVWNVALGAGGGYLGVYVYEEFGENRSVPA